MQIRTRLTLQFLLLGGVIMIVASVLIYISSTGFRRDTFYNLLKSRAVNTAKRVLDSYEFSDLALRSGTEYPSKLPSEKFLILNAKNDTLYLSDRSWEFRNLNAITGHIKSNEDVYFKQDPYEGLGTSYATGIYQFVVVAAAIDNDGILRLGKLRNNLIMVCLLSLVLFAVAGWFYSGRALKPISDMVKKVEDISITSLNLRVPEGNGLDEIGRLAKTFNKMLERLETSFAAQKEFIANASHELRTPLTSINGQLEVLMMKERPAEDYKSSVASVLEDIRSLIDSSNRLLLLARTTSQTPGNIRKKIRIDEVLWQAQEEIMKFNHGYHINISLDDSLTDSEQMTIFGDDYLLKVAVSNIMENACKFSSDHSVSVRVENSGKFIEVIFEDKGIGIPEEDMGKIFEPFYRGANAGPVSGSGIGLPLVNRIVQNHYGTLKISSEIGKGTSVRLRFPSVK
jgi:signal transduction histidine kinase